MDKLTITIKPASYDQGYVINLNCGNQRDNLAKVYTSLADAFTIANYFKEQFDSDESYLGATVVLDFPEAEESDTNDSEPF